MRAYAESVLDEALNTKDPIKIKDALTSLYSGATFFVTSNQIIVSTAEGKTSFPYDTSYDVINNITDKSGDLYFNVDFNNINKDVIVNGTKVSYNKVIAEVIKTDLVLGHTINNGFVIKRMRPDGTLIKESTGRMGAKATAVPTATLKPGNSTAKPSTSASGTTQQKLTKKDIDDFIN